MMNTLNALAALLSYPTRDVIDALPAFLDFVACSRRHEAPEVLAGKMDAIEKIAADLRKRGSAYWAVFEALFVVAEPLGRIRTMR